MRFNRIINYVGISCLALVYTSCSLPSSMVPRKEKKATPASFYNSQDTVNTAKVKWKDFFTDPNLTALIDTALRNNQELNIILQEINIAKNEVRGRKGEYLPFVSAGGVVGVDKASRFTRAGSVDATNEIAPGKSFPDPLPDLLLAANVSWQADIWGKLRNAKRAATFRYLSTTQGKNFMVTHLIAEIANSYYELMALDNQMEILKRQIEIQTNALEIVRLQKIAAKVTELAVRRFEAEVLKNQSRIYYIEQNIRVTENRINFLVGRFPQTITRNSTVFIYLQPDSISGGIPSQLLQNRPDIRKAELELAATKLDVKSAKANFYPLLNISGAIGLEAFSASYFIKNPESFLYNLVGGLMQPLINRNGIKAMYYNANAKQIQAVYNYERTILTAYLEVANQLSNISNLKKSYKLKDQQVEALTESIELSTRLFRSARADYMEVLLTQRDAMESKFELVETKKQQMNAMVNIYQALGGGWK